MSWFTTVFGPVIRLFGGKPKDRPIPKPLPGSQSMRLSFDGSNRGQEAVSAILGYVRAPYQITDRLLTINVVTWDVGRNYFAQYGYDPKNWKSNREGNFYPPKPGFQDGGQIHLVSKSLDQNRRVFLAIHEYGHSIWHWVLTDAEWREWFTPGWTYEEFADDFARRVLGDALDSQKAMFFGRLEKRLTDAGTHSIRL